jgi:hypothetical protein
MKEIILNGINTGVKLERYSDYIPSQKEILNFEKAALTYSIWGKEVVDFMLKNEIVFAS